MVGLSVTNPEQPWEPFQGVNHISNLARSGVAAVSHLAAHGWMEAEPKSLMSAAYASPIDRCDTNARRPHIILLLDESSFDVSQAPGIKVPEGYTDFFKSADGKTRTFVAEATGGPTWYTEFNVLTGLSAQSFGKMKYYVTRIAAGPRHPRPAAIAEALRLSHLLALSELRQFPERAHIPAFDRHRRLRRCGGHEGCG